MNIEAGRNQSPTDQHFLAGSLCLGSIRKLVTQASSNPDVYLDQLLLGLGIFMALRGALCCVFFDDLLLI